jgi:hypothetical protein
MTAITEVRSIKALPKVTVLGHPRDILLLLTAQLRVVAFTQPFQTTLQIAVMVGGHYLLFLIGGELRGVALACSVQASLEVSDPG